MAARNVVERFRDLLGMECALDLFRKENAKGIELFFSAGAKKMFGAKKQCYQPSEDSLRNLLPEGLPAGWPAGWPPIP